MTRSRVLLAAGIAACLSACAGHVPKRDAGAASTTQRGGRLPAETSRAQSERYAQSNDDGPSAPPIDVSKIPEPVPKNEPRSRYGNKPEYSVLGRTYRVMDDPRGYVERGTASWYGNKFHGYMTSSFEPYDMYAFTAAHKTLPLPSYARVTNLDNGKSVVVRVNDRGPFHEDRIIDLSYAAAVKIGVWPKGTGRVEVRAIDPAHPDLPASRTAALSPAQTTRDSAVAVAAAVPPSAPAAVSQPSPRSGPAQVASLSPPRPAAHGAASRIYVQLGAFGERANAERAAASATRAGLEPVDIESVSVGGRTVHRVRVGPLADAEAAELMTAKVERLGLGAPKVAIESP